MKSIHVLVLVMLCACGPGGFTADALEGSETSEPPSEDDGPPGGSEVDDDGDDWESDSGESDSAETDSGETDSGETESGDGDGDNQGAPNGSTCTADSECASENCLVIPFLGGQCGECNQDADCMGGGCTPHDPWAIEGSTCSNGELGGGCESDDACMLGLECSTVFNLLGVIALDTCGECLGDDNCPEDEICVPFFQFQGYSGARTCMPPSSLPQDAYCDLENDGDLACASGICSAADIMGLAQVGACGECTSDLDCGDGTCVAAMFNLDTAELSGSFCESP